MEVPRMKVEEYKALVQRIVENRDNQALVTELATQLNEVYENRYTAYSSLEEQYNEANKQIGDLQRTNMNLFLKVGNPTPPETINEPEPMKYEDLLSSFKI